MGPLYTVKVCIEKIQYRRYLLFSTHRHTHGRSCISAASMHVILFNFTGKSINLKWNIYTFPMLYDVKNIVTYDIIQYKQLK